MITLLSSGCRRILALFYASKNSRIHLREIARKTGLNENSASRFLKQLETDEILSFERDGNLKKYRLRGNDMVYGIMSFFDIEKLDLLPPIRQEAISYFLRELKEKPVIALLFGSTARGGYREDSDIDILLVVNKRIYTQDAEDFAESQTAIKISPIQIRFPDFLKELRLREDKVIESAISTGYPITNHILFYQLTQNEPRLSAQTPQEPRTYRVKNKQLYPKKRNHKNLSK